MELRQSVVEYMRDVISLGIDKNIYKIVKEHPYINLLFKTYFNYSEVFNESNFYNSVSSSFYNINVNRYIEDKRKLIMGKFLESEYRRSGLKLFNSKGKEE